MKHNKLLIAMLAIALPFILSLVACGSSGPPAIGEVVTAKSLDADYKPVEATTTYQPEDTFYVSVQVTDLVVGSTVKVIYKLDGKVYEESTTTADEAGSGHYGFSLKPSDSGHMPGSYTAEVYLDNVLAKTVSFTVEGNAEAQIVAVVMAESVDADGKPVNPTTTFGPTDSLNVSVEVKNVKAGSVIKLVYTFGDQAQEQTITAKQTGSGYFGFQLDPPDSGFPVGDYTVEAFLDDVSFGNPISFSIAE